MSLEVANAKPVEVWKNFVLLNEVPRPSKKEERVIEFLKSFARKNNLLFQQDEIGNLVIIKEATQNMKDCETVVLQSHVDMVHEKNNEVDIFGVVKINISKKFKVSQCESGFDWTNPTFFRDKGKPGFYLIRIKDGQIPLTL